MDMNKNLHIIVPETMYDLLVGRARKAHRSVGDLVRSAVELTYSNPREEELVQRQKLFDLIEEDKRQYGVVEGLDYKQMVEDGRRY